jgi:hypothetical protein
MSSLIAASPKEGDTSAASGPADRELIRWQRHLLPFMIGFVVAMAVAFFIFSGIHLYQVTTFIETEHGQDIRGLIESEIAKVKEDNLSSDDVSQYSLLLLEADTLDKRYHQASALLISRIWSRQLAFITGMVMAFLGAVFILGKLSESASNISGGGTEWKVAITSASPGIILSFLGTILLVSSLYVRASLDVADGPAYVDTMRRRVSPTANAIAGPLDLNELQKLGHQEAAAPQKK